MNSREKLPARKNAGSRKRRSLRGRSWIAGVVSAAVALAWSVGGVVAPSFAADNAIGTNPTSLRIKPVSVFGNLTARDIEAQQGRGTLLQKTDVGGFAVYDHGQRVSFPLVGAGSGSRIAMWNGYVFIRQDNCTVGYWPLAANANVTDQDRASAYYLNGQVCWYPAYKSSSNYAKTLKVAHAHSELAPARVVVNTDPSAGDDHSGKGAKSSKGAAEGSSSTQSVAPTQGKAKPGAQSDSGVSGADAQAGKATRSSAQPDSAAEAGKSDKAGKEAQPGTRSESTAKESKADKGASASTKDSKDSKREEPKAGKSQPAADSASPAAGSARSGLMKDTSNAGRVGDFLMKEANRALVGKSRSIGDDFSIPGLGAYRTDESYDDLDPRQWSIIPASYRAEYNNELFAVWQVKHVAVQVGSGYQEQPVDFFEGDTVPMNIIGSGNRNNSGLLLAPFVPASYRGDQGVVRAHTFDLNVTNGQGTKHFEAYCIDPTTPDITNTAFYGADQYYPSYTYATGNNSPVLSSYGESNKVYLQTLAWLYQTGQLENNSALRGMSSGAFKTMMTALFFHYTWGKDVNFSNRGNPFSSSQFNAALAAVEKAAASHRGVLEENLQYLQLAVKNVTTDNSGNTYYQLQLQGADKIRGDASVSFQMDRVVPGTKVLVKDGYSFRPLDPSQIDDFETSYWTSGAVYLKVPGCTDARQVAGSIRVTGQIKVPGVIWRSPGRQTLIAIGDGSVTKSAVLNLNCAPAPVVKHPTLATSAHLTGQDQSQKTVTLSSNSQTVRLSDDILVNNVVPGKQYWILAQLRRSADPEDSDPIAQQLVKKTFSSAQQLVREAASVVVHGADLPESKYYFAEYLFDEDPNTNDQPQPVAMHDDYRDTKQTITVTRSAHATIQKVAGSFGNADTDGVQVLKATDNVLVHLSCSNYSSSGELTQDISLKATGTGEIPLDSDFVRSITEGNGIYSCALTETRGSNFSDGVRIHSNTLQVNDGAVPVSVTSQSTGYSSEFADFNGSTPTFVFNWPRSYGQNDANIKLKLINQYEKIPVQLTLVKQVSGLSDSNYQGTYKFDVVCDSSGTHEVSISVRGNSSGTARLNNLVPEEHCYVKEHPDSARISGYKEPRVSWVGSISGQESHNSPADDQYRSMRVQVCSCFTSKIVAKNAYTKNDASFNVQKIARFDDGTPIASGDFSLSYSCTNPGDPSPHTGTVALPVTDGESQVKQISGRLQNGAVCTVKENSKPRVSGATFKNVQFVVNGAQIMGYRSGDSEVSFRLQGDSNGVSVIATNTYSKDYGAFRIKKVLRQGSANLYNNDTLFNFQYQCGDDPVKNAFVSVHTPVVVDHLPVGQTCKVWEVKPRATSGADVTVSLSGGNVANDPTHGPQSTFQITKSTGSHPGLTVTATNTVEQHYGKISVTKQVTGTGADLAKNTNFTFHFVCTGSNSFAKSFDLKVKPGHTATSDNLPSGAACQVSETKAKVAGATQESVSWAPSTIGVYNGIATVMVPESNGGAVKTLAVTATNRFTKNLTSFKIYKQLVDLPGISLPSTYLFDYTCKSPNGNVAAKGVQVTANAPAKVISNIPVGANCTVSEQAPPKVAGTSRADTVITATPQGGSAITGKNRVVKFTANQGAVVTVTAVNKYIPDHVGFVLTKQVAGDAQPADSATHSYSFGYECSTASGQKVSGNAQIVPGSASVSQRSFSLSNDQLRAGDTCHVWEVPQSAQRYVDTRLTWSGGRVGDFTDSHSQVHHNAVSFAVAKDAGVSVTATNTYTSQKGGFELVKTANTTDGSDTHPVNTKYNFSVVCGSRTFKGAVTSNDSSSKLVGSDIPLGTSCTVKESQPVSLKGYSLATVIRVNDKVTDHFTIDSDTQRVSVSVANTYTTDKGHFSITKKVLRPAHGDWVQLPSTYKFAYTCKDSAANGKLVAKRADIDGSLSVTEGATEESAEIPVGYVCSVRELTSQSDVRGAKLVSSFAVNGENTSSFKIASHDLVKVVATNSYTNNTGRFEVVKQVTDPVPGGQQPKKFSFSYACKNSLQPNVTVASGDFQIDLKKSTKWESPELPTGAVCTVTEKSGESPTVLGATRSVSWNYSDPEHPQDLQTKTGKGDSFTQVVIGQNNSVRVLRVTNTYNPSDLTLKIRKTNQAPAGTSGLPTAVNFKYDCSIPNTTFSSVGTVSVPTNGTEVSIPADTKVARIPLGAQCTVWEDATQASAEVAGYFHTVDLSVTPSDAEALKNVDPAMAKVTFHTNSQSPTVLINAVNHYSPKPSIGTHLTGQDGKAKTFQITEANTTVNLLDTIAYKDLPTLQNGEKYRFVAQLADRSTGQVIDGLQVVSPLLSISGAGNYQMSFQVPFATVLAHPAGFTAYEYLAKSTDVDNTGKLIGSAQWVASHAPGALNWNEQAKTDQSVTVTVKPVIGTSAMPKGASSRVIAVGKPATIVDTVNYRYLPAGSYVLYGRIIDLSNNDQVVAENHQEVSSAALSERVASWNMELALSAQAVKQAGTNFLVQEYLFPAGTSTFSNLGQAIASHGEKSDTNQIVHTPTLRTTATVDGTHAPALPAGNAKVTVNDEVRYTNLEVGKQYTIAGTLHVRTAQGTDGGELQVNGKAVTASKTFTAQQADGSQTLSFVVPASALAGKVAVAFETLQRDGQQVAAHSDITDEAQTVYFPALRTTATSDQGTKAVLSGSNRKVVDTVTFSSLQPGQSYVLAGELRPVTAGKVAEPVARQNLEFYANSASGQKQVTFTFTAQEGQDYVVFEKLYKAGDVTVTDPSGVLEIGNAKPIAQHAEATSDEQTVSVPKVSTTASVAGGSAGAKYADPSKELTISDEVSYVGLNPNGKYTVTGELHKRTSAGDELVAGSTQTVEIGVGTDKAIGSNGAGKLTVNFPVPAGTLDGSPVVVTETILENGHTVASHVDINSASQTVYTAQMRTNAVDSKDSDHYLSAGQTDVVINDAVTFTGKLAPSTAYTLSGQLVYKETGEVVVKAPQEPVTFTTDSTGGVPSDLVVTYRVPDSKVVAGKTFVAYEFLSEGKRVSKTPVLKHQDLNDAAQTVSVTQLQTHATAEDKESKNLPDSETVTVNDKVTFSGLQVGKTYKVTGTLHYQSAGTLANGTSVKPGDEVAGAVAQPVTITPREVSQTAGSVNVKFTVPRSALAGLPVVVFEDLTSGGLKVASHQDLNDASQTVYAPQLKTFATGKAGAKVVQKGVDATINDRVVWSALAPGDYYMMGSVVDTHGKAIPGISAQPVKFTVSKGQQSGEVNLAFQVSASALANYTDGTVTVFEKAYQAGDVIADSGKTTLKENAKPVATHTVVGDQDQTLQVATMRTNATDGADGDHYVDNSQDATIVDTVTYSGLDPQQVYSLTGELMEKTVSGSASTGITKTIWVGPAGAKNPTGGAVDQQIAASGSGSFRLEFQIPATKLVGKTVVAFETLRKDGQEFLIHHDINDAAQTVRMPGVATTAQGDRKGLVSYDSEGNETVQQWVVEAQAGGSIVDHVAYTNLQEGKQYTVAGELVSRVVEKGGKVSVSRTGIKAQKTFTAKSANGLVDVQFTVPANAYPSGSQLVAFESLYLGSGTATRPVATHENPEDKAQTVPLVGSPDIRTVLQVANSDRQAGAAVPVISADKDSFNQLVDHVSYTNLVPGARYKLDAQLVVKDPEQSSGYKGTKNVGTSGMFTPAEANGSYDVPIAITDKSLLPNPGTSIVAFETLSVWNPSTGKWEVVKEHNDANDADQTVTFGYHPQVGTTLTGTDLKAKVIGGLDKDITVTDKVAYQGLTVGKPYVIVGKLVNQKDGKEIASVVTDPFKPEKSKDNKYVQFPVTSVQLKQLAASTLGDNAQDGELKLVAFEYLYSADKIVDGSVKEESGSPVAPDAKHENINDPAQTVTVTKSPKIGTTLTASDGKAKVVKVGDGVKVIDTVAYYNLKPNTQYTLVGHLMGKVKATDANVVDSGAVAKATFTTPQATDTQLVSGQVKVEIPVSRDVLKKFASLVAYEQLFTGTQVTQTPLAKHEDPTDPAQTVTVTPISVGTVANVAGRSNVVLEDGAGKEKKPVSLVDKVSYTGLTPGKTYALSGVVMDRDKNVPLQAAGKDITNAVTFAPKQSDGFLTMSFQLPFDSLVDGERVVVFEKLYEPGTFTEVSNGKVTVKDNAQPIAQHADINSDSQTVSVRKPKFGDFTLTKKLANWVDQGPNSPHANREDVEYHFSYDCLTPKVVDGKTKYVEDGHAGAITLKENQASARVEGLPDGAKCTVTENLDMVTRATGAQSTVTWKNGDQALASSTNGQVSFVIGANADRQFSFDITATNALHEEPSMVTDTVSSLGGKAVTYNGKFTDVVKYWNLPKSDYVLYTYFARGVSADKAEPIENVGRQYTLVSNDQVATSGQWSIEVMVPNELTDNQDLIVWQDLYRASDFDTQNKAPKPAAKPVASHHEVPSVLTRTTQLVKFITNYGQFKVGKIVTTDKGLDKAVVNRLPKQFTFDYTCKVPEGATVKPGTALTGALTINGGTATAPVYSAPVTDLPVGTTCKVSERTVVLPTGVVESTTWTQTALAGNPVGDASVSKELNISIGAAANLTVTATNAYSKVEPKIATVAKTAAGSKVLNNFGGNQIVDTVTYQNLVSGRQYILEGTLHYTDGSAVLGKDGKPVVVSKPVVADGVAGEHGFVSGDWKMTFQVPTKLDPGKDLVVYENLYEDSGAADNAGAQANRALVAQHADPNSQAQTISHQPKLQISTVAAIIAASENAGSATVSPSASAASVSAAASASTTPASVSSSLTPATATAESSPATAGAASPAATVEATEPAVSVSTANAKLVKQFKVGSESTVLDKVTYSGLNPNTHYLLRGQVKKVADSSAVTDVVEQQVTSTANGSGTWEIQIPLTAEQTTGLTADDKLVVFERVFDAEGKQAVLEHTDAEDISQQVIPVLPPTNKTPSTPPTLPSTTTPGTTPVTTPVTTVISTPPTPPVSPAITRPALPKPPVAPAHTAPALPKPPVLPAFTVAPRKPLMPMVLAHTGAQAALVGGLAVLLILAGAGLGVLARRRFDSAEES